MITIKSRNTVVLEPSLRFSDDKKTIKYQANTELYVDGNPYLDLFTTQTIFDLTCPSSDVENILETTQNQIDNYIKVNYPPVP